jgi:hypothetical protein
MFFSALAITAVVLPAALPPAFAKVAPYIEDIADVKGLWLDVPSFPAAEFDSDGAKRWDDGDEYGYFSFRRGLPDNRWTLVVDRYRWSDETIPGGEDFYPVTEEKARAFLVSHSAVPEEAKIEVRADETASGILTYPVTRARCDFKTGSGEALTAIDLFIPTDTYLFWVHLTAPKGNADTFTEDVFTAWFESMEFRDDPDAPGAGTKELMLEAPDYPGASRVIESTRHIDSMMFKISRYNAADGWAPKTPGGVPDFIKELVKNGNGATDKIKFDPKIDAQTSKRFGHPCVITEYTEGSNEDTRVVDRIFIFAGEYVFDVEMSVAADDYDECSHLQAEWATKLEFVQR